MTSPSASGATARAGVLLLADSQEWETDALTALRGSREHVVARRCLDVADLMAVAVTGEASLALVAGDASGFDAACVAHLRAHGVAVVAVVPTGVAGAWTAPRGTAAVVESDVSGLAAALTGASRRAAAPDAPDEDGGAEERDGSGPRAGTRRPAPLSTSATSATSATDRPGHDTTDRRPGRVLAVWGPVGSPGRTTVALALAGELASRRRPTTLLDLDAWGGTVAQHLGILGEVSGLLAAARSASGGTLTPDRAAELCVRVGEHLGVLTGLPHADRWSEVGVGTVDRVVDAVRGRGDVVLDVGFALDPATLGGWGGPPAREHLATEAVALADHVLLVGTADPVGLSRLVRAAEQLGGTRPEGTDVVVLNRVRSSLGWSSEEVVGLVEAAVPGSRVVTLPEDRVALDRALAEGSLLVESGAGALRATVRDLVDDVVLDLLAPSGGASTRSGRGDTGGAGRARWSSRLRGRGSRGG